jgi:nicotinate-nucleotide--dimethylbenzimidazole phosphoribosyltransferase
VAGGVNEAALEASIKAVAAAIAEPDPSAARHMRARLDQKTKPRGSLGRLEQLARRVAAIRGDGEVGPLPAAIVVAAADHGVAAEGVSAYPGEVTAQMLVNFARGGAAINVLARRAGAELLVVDAGVSERVQDSGIRSVRAGAGTANFKLTAAMERGQALEAIKSGIEIAYELDARGIGIVALGEMGIANTTSAAALAASLLELEPRGVCGRGTGLDDAGLTRKVSVVRTALRRHKVGCDDPVGALAALGGFEIALLTGVVLGAAAARMVVLIDGFITAAAALVASTIEPRATRAMIAAHLSPEPGHRAILERLELKPLLDLGLRLGEGTGAALALPLVQASLALAREMATFTEAMVSDAGR